MYSMRSGTFARRSVAPPRGGAFLFTSVAARRPGGASKVKSGSSSGSSRLNRYGRGLGLRRFILPVQLIAVYGKVGKERVHLVAVVLIRRGSSASTCLVLDGGHVRRSGRRAFFWLCGLRLDILRGASSSASAAFAGAGVTGTGSSSSCGCTPSAKRLN